VIDRHRNERIAFHFDVGVEVIVGDLRDDHVSFGIPRQYGMRQAETGTETGQEFGHLGRDGKLLL
jgi:hypothetical protein